MRIHQGRLTTRTQGHTHMRRRFRSLVRSTQWMLLAIVIGTTATACHFLDDLLNVQAPDQIETKTLEAPENATLLTIGAQADFECAYGAFVVTTGLMSGELMETTQTASRWSYDRRSIDPSESHYSTFTCEDIGLYTPASIARFTADHVLNLLHGCTDEQVENRTELIARAAAYSGYSRIILGEAFCEAAIDLGPRESSQQLFQEAIDTLTEAIQAARDAGVDSLRYLAFVGRARAELDAGMLEAAAQDADSVPSDFVYNATADISTLRRENRVFAEFNGHGVSVAPQYRNLTVGSTPDPRVVVVDAGRFGADEKTEEFDQTKYETGDTPIPLASYIEAQLIKAEALGGSEAVSIINALRSTVGLPAFSSSDPDEIAAQVLEERARWLFLQGNRLYDVRSHNLPLVPAAGTQYSIDHAKGGSYGDETCMPIPNVETQNNPNARG